MQQSHIVVEMMKIFQECARSPAAAPSLRVANKLAVTVCACVCKLQQLMLYIIILWDYRRLKHVHFETTIKASWLCLKFWQAPLFCTHLMTTY